MSPALAEILLTLAAKFGAEVFEKAVTLVHKDDPTKEDWLALADLIRQAEAKK